MRKVDTFQFSAPDIGAFKQLRVTSDDSGLGSAWHLAKVVVTNVDTGEGGEGGGKSEGIQDVVEQSWTAKELQERWLDMT